MTDRAGGRLAPRWEPAQATSLPARVEWFRRAVRPDLTPGLSWPLSAIKGLGRSLRQAGQAYALIAGGGYLRGGVKRRVLRYRYAGQVPVPPLTPCIGGG